MEKWRVKIRSKESLSFYRGEDLSKLGFKPKPKQALAWPVPALLILGLGPRPKFVFEFIVK